MQPDSTMQRLLAHLRRGGQFGYYWVVSADKREKITVWHPADTVARVPAEVNGHGPRHIYYGVHPAALIPQERVNKKTGAPYTPRPEQVRPEIEEIAAINCLYGDFDAKDYDRDDLVRGKGLAWERLEAVPVPASVVIHSGGGYQGLWLLDQPFVLDTPEKRERAKALQERWVAFIGSDANVHDLPRVLRMPGTHNYKYDPAPLADVVRADFDRLYTLDALEQLLPADPPTPPKPAYTPSRGLTPRSGDHLRRWVDEVIDRACTRVATAPSGAGSDWRVDMGKLAGGVAHTGVYSDEELVRRVLDAALARSTDDARETERNIRNGFAYGKASPLTPKPFPTDQSILCDAHGVGHCPSCDTPVLRSKYDYPGTSDKAWYCPECRGVMQWPAEAYTPPAVAPRQQPSATAGDDDQGTTGAAATAQPKGVDTTRLTLSEKITAWLTAMGYTFRLNRAGNIVECNGTPLDDDLAATIRVQYRDAGMKNIGALEDVCRAQARTNAYHPVRSYLDGLMWDGTSHISKLATYLKSSEPPITYAPGDRQRSVVDVYLYRWLIGAVAKAYDGHQTSMLVLGGPQGIGKSYFIRWLASPLPAHYLEAPIQPGDRDSMLRFATSWIWEVAELGATTRRADRDALKDALTRSAISLRKAYGRYDTHAPVLASFIGTVNPDHAGFLDDPTGSRRYWVVTIDAIDRAYTTAIDVHQVWAEAVAAYRSGETWQLSPDEERNRERVNAEHEVEDPMLGLLEEFFVLDADPSNRMDSAQMMLVLADRKAPVSFHNPRALAMDIARALKKRGVKKVGDGTRRCYVGVMPRVAASD